MTQLKTEVERVIAAGSLGRSGTYIRLLNYLATATEEGRVIKDVDLATDVLGRVDVNSVSNSTARVYVHNLRQKLETHYDSAQDSPGPMLVIPKGKYKLVLEQPNESFRVRFRTNLRLLAPAIAAAVLSVAALSFFVGRWLVPAPGNPADSHAGNSEFAAAPSWSAILDDNTPVTIFLGNYFVFLEADGDQRKSRLIREFSINSADELRRWQESHPENRGNYLDINLTYLPTGTAAALNEVLRVLRPTERAITVVPQSKLRAEQLRETHVIYLGYLSGMGNLQHIPFLASRLKIGESYDVLIDFESGTRFESSAGFITDADVSYQDFGYVATFPGSAGNQFLYITGMRDEGLMQMASILSKPESVNSLGSGFVSAGAPAFEALFQVRGIERTYVESKELFTSAIDATQIWMEASQ